MYKTHDSKDIFGFPSTYNQQQIQGRWSFF